MADESELRRMLEREAAGAPAPELDAGQLARKSRARRLPRQLAAGGAVAIAVIGIGVGTVTGVRMINPPAEVSSAGGGAETADEDAGTFSEEGAGGEAVPESATGGGTELAPAYKVNGCGGMLAGASDPELTGLVVSLDFPAEAEIGDTVRGSVEITNAGEETLSGRVDAAAATTLSEDGVVLWHTPRVDSSVPLELAPGETTTLDASFQPAVCSSDHEGLEDFPPDLPDVDRGSYEVSVAFDIVRADGPTLQVVSGTEPITLR